MDKVTQETVEQFQVGDRAAFAFLVSQYQNLVTSTALAETGDFQRSEDVAQQAFLVAWQKRGELKDAKRFGGWLRGIARNLARNERRLKANEFSRRGQEIAPHSEPVCELRPDEATLKSEQSRLLWSTLDRIPTKYREPMILFYREDQSIRAVANLLELSEDAVKQRLRRGREMLKDEVRAMVEEIIVETTPSSAFSAAVMATIPTATSVTKSGFFVGVKAMFTKSFAAISGVGALGGLLGAFGGILGAWVATKHGIKHSTSEPEKRLHRSFFAGIVVMSFVYTGAMLFTVTRAKVNANVPLSITAGFAVLLVGGILWFSQRQRALHKTYGRPKYLQDTTNNFPGPAPVSVNLLRWNIIGAVAGGSAWLPVYAFVESAFGVMAISLNALILHLVWLWRRAELHNTVNSQIRFNARSVLETSVIQAVVMLVALACGSELTKKTVQGVSFWIIIPGLLIFGFLAYRLMLLRIDESAE